MLSCPVVQLYARRKRRKQIHISQINWWDMFMFMLSKSSIKMVNVVKTMNSPKNVISLVVQFKSLKPVVCVYASTLNSIFEQVMKPSKLKQMRISMNWIKWSIFTMSMPAYSLKWIKFNDFVINQLFSANQVHADKVQEFKYGINIFVLLNGRRKEK